MAGKVTECALVPVSAFRRKGDAKRLPRFAISPPGVLLSDWLPSDPPSSGHLRDEKVALIAPPRTGLNRRERRDVAARSPAGMTGIFTTGSMIASFPRESGILGAGRFRKGTLRFSVSIQLFLYQVRPLSSRNLSYRHNAGRGTLSDFPC